MVGRSRLGTGTSPLCTMANDGSPNRQALDTLVASTFLLLQADGYTKVGMLTRQYYSMVTSLGTSAYVVAYQVYLFVTGFGRYSRFLDTDCECFSTSTLHYNASDQAGSRVAHTVYAVSRFPCAVRCTPAPLQARSRLHPGLFCPSDLVSIRQKPRSPNHSRSTFVSPALTRSFTR